MTGCLACADLDIVGTDGAAYLHGAASEADRVAHEHLRQRIETLNRVQAERDRLHDGNERARELLSDLLEHLAHAGIPISKVWWDAWIERAEVAVANTEAL